MKTVLLTLLSIYSLSLTAAVLPVINTADSGPGSLRDQITAATSGDTVSIQTTGITHLASGQITISKSITIQGPGADQYAVDADSLSRVFQTSSGTDVTIIGITIKGGKATLGGGIWSYGSLTLIECGVTDNSASGPGGGINTIGDLVLIRTSIYNNTAGTFGGGVVNNFFAVSSFFNSTFSGNTSGNDGGAIYSNGVLNINHCTITFNESLDSAGGFYNRGASIIIQNSIVAKNTGLNGAQDYFLRSAGSITSLGYNLIGINDDAGCAGCFAAPGDLTGTLVLPLSAGLGVLTDNGGSLPTHLPSVGSPVIDAANPASGFAEDQRGEMRPFGAAADIGSVELQGGCAIPTGLTAIPGIFTATISWDPVPDAFGYQVKGRPLGASSFGRVQTADTIKVIGGLMPGTTYEWKVRAACPTDTTSFSPLNTFATLTPRLSKPESQLYPNPASVVVFVAAPGGSQLEFHSIDGRLMAQTQASDNGQTAISIAKWPDGVYIVSIKSEDSIQTEKLTIRK